MANDVAYVTLSKKSEWVFVTQRYLGNSYGDLYIRLYARYTKQDYDENRTYVEYEGRTYYSGTTYIADQQGEVEIHGDYAESKKADAKSVASGETALVKTGAWVPHDDDGTKRVNAHVMMSFPNWGWAVEPWGTITLPTIPRTTKLNGWTGAVEMESSTVLNISPSSNSFQHSLCVYGTDFGTFYINPNNGSFNTNEIKSNSKVWNITPDNSLYERFSGSQIRLTVKLTTYSSDGNTSIGFDVGNLTLQCNEQKCKPKITSHSHIDINNDTKNLTKNEKRIIANKSTVKTNFDYSVSSSADNNASITEIKINGTNVALGTKTDTRTANSDNYVSVFLANSRGFSETYNLYYDDFVSYYNLEMNNGEVQRAYTDSGSETNTTALATIGGRYFNGYFASDDTNKNPFKFEFKYREKTDNASWSEQYKPWVYDSTFASNVKYDDYGNFSISEFPLKDNSNTAIQFEYHTEYEIQYWIADQFNEVYKTITLIAANPVFSWDDDNFRVTDTFTIGDHNTSFGVVGVRSTSNKTISGTSYNVANILEDTIDHYSKNGTNIPNKLMFNTTTIAHGTHNFNSKFQEKLVNVSASNTQSGWQKICNVIFDSHTQGEFAHINIYIGDGNNGNATQNAYIELLMQIGWVGSNEGRVGCVAKLHPFKTGFSTLNTNVMVIANSNINYDIWVKTDTYYCLPNYTANCSAQVTVTQKWENSSSTPTGTTCNLVYKSDQPTVLYNNTTGTNGTVTLGHSAANYDYLEIYFRTNDSDYANVRVFSPDGKAVTLSAGVSNSGSHAYLKYKNVKINGTTISVVSYSELNIYSGTPNFSNSNNIYITRVEGINNI